MFLGRVDVATLVEIAVTDIIDCDGGNFTRIEVSMDRRARTIRVIDDDASWRADHLAPECSFIERLACELFCGHGPAPRGMGSLAMINALSEQLALGIAHPAGGYAQRFVRSEPEPPVRSPGTTLA